MKLKHWFKLLFITVLIFNCYFPVLLAEFVEIIVSTADRVEIFDEDGIVTLYELTDEEREKILKKYSKPFLGMFDKKFPITFEDRRYDYVIQIDVYRKSGYWGNVFVEYIYGELKLHVHKVFTISPYHKRFVLQIGLDAMKKDYEEMKEYIDAVFWGEFKKNGDSIFPSEEVEFTPQFKPKI